VYFTIDISKKDADIYYVLEAQRLIHTPGKSVFREKWLKDIITTKTMMMDDVTF
jgi:A-kinase anchor protein 14